MARKPSGGVGSNQYATRGRSHPKGQVRVDSGAVAAAAAAELEQTAAAFGRQDLADPKSCDTHEMVRIAATGTTWERGVIAGRSDCPDELVEWIAANDPDAAVWMTAWRRIHPDDSDITSWYPYAAAETSTARWVLERLAKDRERTIRRNVATNHACPRELLEQLAEDPDGGVRAAVKARTVTSAHETDTVRAP